MLLYIYLVSAFVVIVGIVHHDAQHIKKSLNGMRQSLKDKNIYEFNENLKEVGFLLFTCLMPAFNTIFAVLFIGLIIGLSLWYLTLRVFGFSHTQSYEETFGGATLSSGDLL